MKPFTEEKAEGLIQMVEESNEAVAHKLGIPRKWILPLENLVKVEDLERLLEEKDRNHKEKDCKLSNQAREIQDLKQKLEELAKKHK